MIKPVYNIIIKVDKHYIHHEKLINMAFRYNYLNSVYQKLNKDIIIIDYIMSRHTYKTTTADTATFLASQ